MFVFHDVPRIGRFMLVSVLLFMLVSVLLAFALDAFQLCVIGGEMPLDCVSLFFGGIALSR